MGSGVSCDPGRPAGPGHAGQRVSQRIAPVLTRLALDLEGVDLGRQRAKALLEPLLAGADGADLRFLITRGVAVLGLLVDPLEHALPRLLTLIRQRVELALTRRDFLDARGQLFLEFG